MTINAARERLKHIAGLCYSLSMDLDQLQDENAILREQVKQLTAERNFYKQPPQKTAEQKEERRQKQAERMREYHANKRAQKIANGEILPPKPKLTPEEVKERNKLAVKKYQAKKKAEKEKLKL